MSKKITYITKSQLTKLIESTIKESLKSNKKRRLNEGEIHDFIENITMSYLEACAWSTSGSDEDGNDYESLEDFEFSEEAQTEASANVKKFVSLCEKALGKDIYQICQDNGQGISDFGHDLWLTSAGHGAGFWDGDWDVDGDALTNLVKRSGLQDQDAYLGDDGLIYFM